MIDEFNGCGGKGSWFKPPFKKFFEASCNKHDIGYGIGGDEAKRFECDGKFLIMMLKDTFKEKKWTSRVFYQWWAFAYFLGVRMGGEKFFNYTTKSK
jgi:hypothetical protein